jgi:2-oxoglutarate dehydrogenase E2 component (dihydrolipoamide succinyltransferase)
MVEVVVPNLGESIVEAMVSEWLKDEGDIVAEGEPIVIIETDKTTMEVYAPKAGKIAKKVKQKGETAKVGEVLCVIEEGVFVQGKPPEDAPNKKKDDIDEKVAMPSAKKVAFEEGVDLAKISGSGKGGRILKEDVIKATKTEEKKDEPVEVGKGAVEGAQEKVEESKVIEQPELQKTPVFSPPVFDSAREVEIVPMSMLRRTVAERLVQAKQTMALLTTFNEIDMSNVLALRKRYQEQFQEKYGVKLGIVSFFVLASVSALKRFKQVNGSIQGTNMVLYKYYDIGIAIGSKRGLVVPVLRDADKLTLGEIEQKIADFAKRAEEGKLALEELQGGTFTISNGGIFGSLLSTPIPSPPQSAVLGLHAIQERPVARDGQVVIRPMMFVALTYDHRIIDGREAVSFLRHIKEVIEDPSRLVLGL